jgi:hypothetical protein
VRSIGGRTRCSWGTVVRRFATILAGVLHTASPAAAIQLGLQWIDNSGGIASFVIERRTGTTGTYAQIATTAAGVTSFVDTTVVADTIYCYRVGASSAGIVSGYSNEACNSAATSLGVTVVKAGAGLGIVHSSPAGINCGTACVVSFGASQVVTLTATAASGSVFNGWSGGCTGTGPCTIMGNTSITVIATFSRRSGS